jgi:hypothetical protein
MQNPAIARYQKRRNTRRIQRRLGKHAHPRVIHHHRPQPQRPLEMWH